MMALYPTEWELKEREAAKDKEQKELEKRRKKFVEEFSKLSVEEVAEKFFNLALEVEGLRRQVGRMGIRFMRC
jgi:hypothetical protein